MQTKQPDGEGSLDYDEALDMLKASLSLEYNPKNIPPIETEPSFGSYPFWCRSQAARFVWTKVAEWEMDLQNTHLVPREEWPFMKAMIYSMSQYELLMFAETVPYGGLEWQAERVFRRLYSNEKEEPRRNETIDELIVRFCSGDPDERHNASTQLCSRFGAQSYVDQVKTIKALLKGDYWDQEWCYGTMKTWWSDELIADVQRAWETFHEKECAGIVARKLPSSYVVSHRAELEEKDYASVCLRLCTNENSHVDDTRLNRTEFIEIVAHNHWNIDDNDADELLFGYLLEVLTGKYSHCIDYYEYNTTCCRADYTKQSERMNYRPSLLSIKAVEKYVIALGKVGKTNTIIKFYRWNKHVQQLLDDYLADLAIADNLAERMKEDFGAYQGWIWKTIKSLALQSFPFDVNEFWKTHNKYHFSNHDTPYYYGQDWRDELFFERF